MLLQEGSTDADVLEEVFAKNVYGTSLATGQTWIDVGGHRGRLAILAWLAGAKQVDSYETHLGNAKVHVFEWPGVAGNRTAAGLCGGWNGEEHHLACESQS